MSLADRPQIEGTAELVEALADELAQNAACAHCLIAHEQDFCRLGRSHCVWLDQDTEPERRVTRRE